MRRVRRAQAGALRHSQRLPVKVHTVVRGPPGRRRTASRAKPAPRLTSPPQQQLLTSQPGDDSVIAVLALRSESADPRL
jgi:hypothetical protein